MNLHLSKFLALACAMHSFFAVAQELSPRAYWPTPTGTQVFTVGYSHKKGDIIPDRSLPLTGVDSSIDSVHLGYRRTFGLFDRTANITLELPTNNGTTVATNDVGAEIERSYRGVGDIAATFSINLLGAPALVKPEFRKQFAKTRHVVGVSLKVLAPTGEYESDKLINVGANRWAVKAEVGYISVLTSKWLLETSLGAWFFQDNDNFLGYTKKQDPVVAFQGHLIHRFRPGLWASIDLNYYEGGRSDINGRRLDDIQKDSKIGATLVFPFAAGHAVKLGYTTGSLSDSDEDYDIFQISYSRVF